MKAYPTSLCPAVILKTLIVITTVLLLVASSLQAATHTWKGSNTNDLWSHGPNWTSGVAPTAAESDVKLVFPAGTELNPVNNIVGLDVSQFIVTGAGYTFSGVNGAKLTLSGGAADNFVNQVGSSATTTIAPSLPVVLGGLIVTFANNSGNLTIESTISGPGIMIRRGVGVVALKGTTANTFTGSLYCQAGVTIFLKPAGVNAIGGGEIVIGDPAGVVPAYLTLSRSNQIPDGMPVRLDPKGEMDLSDGTTEKVGTITLNAGEIIIGYNDPATTLTMGGNLNCLDATTDASKITGAGALSLGGQNRTFTVESNLGLPVLSRIIDGGGVAGFTKTGTGYMSLHGDNTFTGQVSVTNGVLSSWSLGALGSGQGDTVVSGGALLNLGVLANESISLQGAHLFAHSGSGIFGSLQVSGLCQIGTAAGSVFQITGALNGTGALIASAENQGTIELNGNKPGNFSGSILMQGGTFQLNTSLVSAYHGSLQIATADVKNPAKVICLTPNQLSSQTDVVLDGGLVNELDLNGMTTTIRSLSGGGTVSLGAAKLNLEGSNTTEFHGVITGSGPVGIVKNGSGMFTINPSVLKGVTLHSSYTGQTIINEGVMVINDIQPTSFLVNDGGKLTGTGTVGNVSISGGGKLGLGSLKTAGINGSGAGNQITAALNGSSNFEHVKATGTVSLTGTVLTLNLTFDPFANASFMLIENDGADAVVGSFLGLPEGALLMVGGKPFLITYQGGDGNDVVLTFTGVGQVLPEITSFFMDPAMTVCQIKGHCAPNTACLWQKSGDLIVWTDMGTASSDGQGEVITTFALPAGKKPAKQFYRLAVP